MFFRLLESRWSVGVRLWVTLNGKSTVRAVAGFSVVKLPRIPGSGKGCEAGEAIVRSGSASPTADWRRQVG